MRFPLLCLFVVFLLGSARAAEPFLKKDDVIALVGGEDMVVASEYGYLELLLTRALPDYHLRFRNLAWEGDTVFEQRRDLNFPSWEEQLDKIGATVVICQFGQMESLAGKEKLPEFIATYEKLLERLGSHGKRRMLVLSPCAFSQSATFTPKDAEQYRQTEWMKSHDESSHAYAKAIGEAATRQGARFVDNWDLGTYDVLLQRDGIHLTGIGHLVMDFSVLRELNIPVDDDGFSRGLLNAYIAGSRDSPGMKDATALRNLIIAKNRLWFDYWRVQNWAFLAGDRTNQPSSRDWRDPSKRWFPAEREEFLPLIEAKEKEIDALAAKLKSN